MKFGWITFVAMLFLTTETASVGVTSSIEEASPICHAKLNEECSSTEDCCLGTCIAKHCNDGLYKNSRDRTGGPADPSQLIASELATGKNVDISEHKYAHLLPSPAQCGFSALEPKRQKRIVGGTPYKLGKYPWGVALHYNDIAKGDSLFSCGGSLITNRHVVTAAHCVTRLAAGIMLKWVTLGNVDRRLKDMCERNKTCTNGSYVDVEIEEIVVHEQFSEAHVRYDIALIRLKQEVNFTDVIRPICMPRSEDVFKDWSDGKLTVIGWGTQNFATDNGPKQISWVAQEVENVLVHRSNCDRFYSMTIGALRRSQICAGGYPGKGDCAGDSGSSLFKKLRVDVDKKKGEGMERYVLFGLVSTGAVIKCAREGKPSVYTSITYYLPWILENLIPQHKAVAASIARVPINPRDVFQTGLSPPVDVSTHPNAALLPKFPNCGPIKRLKDRSGPSAWFPPPTQPANNTQSDVLQAKKRVKRIVGGMVQAIGKFPYMAQVYARHTVTGEPILRCGGMLITNRHVLTAAHCVSDMRGPYAVDGVVLGNFNRRQQVECLENNECINQTMIPLDDLVIHESFTRFARENDVAILRLNREVTFSKFIQPICLPLSEDIVSQAWPHNDTKYTVAGWGRVTQESGENVMSNFLIAANFTLESKAYCESALTRRVGRLEKSRVCGGGVTPEKGECIGDNGGPMMRWVTIPGPNGANYTRMFAFGILSVVECAHQGIPSLYQNMLFHMPWIMNNLKVGNQ